MAEKQVSVEVAIKTEEQNNLALIEQANAITVASAEDVEAASKIGKTIAERIKAVDAKRTEYVKPLNDTVKKINADFKTILEPLEKAKTLLAGGINKWQREENERLRKEEARRQKIADAAEAKRKEADPDFYRPAPTITVEKPANTIGNAAQTKFWTFEETDFSKVPDEYKVIDRVKVNKAIAEGAREIPGLNIYQDTRTSFR